MFSTHLSHARTRTSYYVYLQCDKMSIDDVERVASVKLLGIIFQDNFKMDMHVNFVLSQCSQRLYLLKLLRSQGLLPS